jgi:hypothetical protein
VKAVLRGWFTEFVGAEVAQSYLGALHESDRIAYRRFRGAALKCTMVLAATALVVPSVPRAARHAPLVETSRVAIPSGSRLALAESLAVHPDVTLAPALLHAELKLDPLLTRARP